MIIPLTLGALALAYFVFSRRDEEQNREGGLELPPTKIPLKPTALKVPPKPNTPPVSQVLRVPPRPGSGTVAPSPIKTVSDAEWTRFGEVMITGKADGIDDNYNLGLWRIGAKKLADVGIMTGVKKQIWPPLNPAGKTVWLGTWVSPYSAAKFLGDKKLQYKVFQDIMRLYTQRIVTLHKNALGATFDGIKATMSGLLAVMWFAGADGFAKWITDPADRKKFASTTAVFKRANGIF